MRQGHPVRLYPQPRQLQWLDGENRWSSRISVNASEEARQAAERVRLQPRLRQAIAGCGEGGAVDQQPATAISVNHREELHPQGYVLEWNENGLRIEYSRDAGLYYALVTVEQLLSREGVHWNCFRIEDAPDFPVRGIMLDIGRHKIPKLTELYKLVDRMAELKLNHLQLYMEGYCFEYEQYKDAFPGSTPLTAAELRQLDVYAAQRFVDLVPNQNCLGHMGEWLNKPEFRELAEHPNGLPLPNQVTFPPTTLNPVDPRSIDLIKNLFDALLPNFSSSYVNVNMDEPYGLGAGQSKERCDEIGVGQLYMEYADHVFELVRSHGKKPLMWGDVLASHPEIMDRIPEDVTVLDWNYECNISFEAHCKMLGSKGISFYVCPGTSSWSAISGRTDNMLDNVSDAAVHGLKYGASGLIVADWGDNGHWQVPAVSYPGYVYAAGVSWQTQQHLHQSEWLENYISEEVYQDESGEIGSFLLELGRYYHLERSTLDNATYTMRLLMDGIKSPEQFKADMTLIMKIFGELGGPGGEFNMDYSYAEMMEWLLQRKEQHAKLKLRDPEAETVVDELTNTLRLIEQGIGLHRYLHRIDLPDQQAEIECLTELRAGMELAVREFVRLWCIRNREGGLESSTWTMKRLLDQYQERIEELTAADAAE